MNACLDFGNTRIKVGIFNNNDLIEIQKVQTLDETSAYLNSFKLDALIISSVTYQKQELFEFFNFVNQKYFLNSSTALPIRNNYHSPETLGQDRIAAIVGANGLFPNENLLVVDLGTAIKYDFINNENEFEGGIISPGKQMRFKALHTFTKKLPMLESNEIPDLIGKNTEECMKTGVMNGMLAEINGIINEYIKEYQTRVLLCGGDAPYFESRIKCTTFAAPNLVLLGLNRILEYNVNAI